MYHCRHCYAESKHRTTMCQSCKKWHSMVDGPAPREEEKGYRITSYSPISGAIPSTAVETDKTERVLIGIPEVDRVTGGGFVKGGVYLLTAEPGCGKSTLATQCASIAQIGDQRTFYVCGEETPGRVADRAARVGGTSDRFLLWKEKDIEGICEAIIKEKPRFVVVDSIQAVFSLELDSSPGSTSQMMACTQKLVQVAQNLAVPIVIIGHVTKDKNAAGPRKLEHDVDAFLHMDGDRAGGYRFLRAFKNRFGSTAEVGIFRMGEDGLVPVDSASGVFHRKRKRPIDGVAMTVVAEGSRMFVAEIQCLTSDKDDKDAPARRSISGLDRSRCDKIIAALKTYTGLKLSAYDIYLSTLGGLEISDPGADLAIALAIVSSVLCKPVSQVVAIGEISLTGEVCGVEDGDAKAAFVGGVIQPADDVDKNGVQMQPIPDDYSLCAVELAELSSLTITATYDE